MPATILPAEERSERTAAAETRRRWALAALLCLGSLAAALVFRHAMAVAAGGRWVLPLDDAYIHQQYARQAAVGLPWRYNSQDPPTSGATSLLYPFLLAVPWGLGVRGDGLSLVAFLLGALTLPLGAWYAARLASALAGNRARPWAAPLAGALYLANGALLFGHTSGMETGLLLIALLAYAESLVCERTGGAAAWGVGVALFRPEGLVFVVVGSAWLAWRGGRQELGRRAPALALPLLAALAQPLLNLALTGSLTANGMRVKSWLYEQGTDVLWLARTVLETLGRLLWTTLVGLPIQQALPAAWRQWREVTLYLPPLAGLLAGVALFCRARSELRSRRPGAGSLLGALVLAGLAANAVMMTAEWHLYRYALPVFALVLAAAVAALARISSRRLLSAALACFWLAGSFVSAGVFVRYYREAVATTLHQQIALGEWIRDHLPADSRIAVHDAGAIRYYGERATYDMLGLTAPAEVSEAWRLGSGALYQVMARQPERPTHLAVYPDVAHFPYLVAAGLMGEPLFTVQHPTTLAAASDTQVVCVADWSLAETRERPLQADIGEIVAGLSLVDGVDVADPASEAAHQYRQWAAPGGPEGLTEVHRLTTALPPHPEATDGGRMITGGEAFTLATRLGDDLVLVGRFLGTNPAILTVYVDGTYAGELRYLHFDGAWQERALLVPGELVRAEHTRFEVHVAHAAPGFAWHRPYRWWAYQGDLELPAPHNLVDAANAEGVRLLGYDLALQGVEDRLHAQVTLYWNADRAIDRDLVVFVHWVDEADRAVAQVDTLPRAGARPTWSWQPGFVLADELVLSAPVDALGPRSTLYVGLYDAKTLEPAPLQGADPAGRLVLERIELP